LFDVVVISERDRRVGMVVGRIQDIVSTPLKVQPWVGRRGLLGSAIVQNQVTSLVDVPGILREAAHLPNGDPAHLT
jgi:two-component system chemotaxis sensor kinase CheA